VVLPQSDPEVTVTILGGLDIHRAQLTYDYVDLATGEVQTGRIAPANRGQLRLWLERFQGLGEVAFALEGCTGWRYVVEELVRVGATAHVAEPAETAALRGRKSRAKTDRADARHLRQLLVDGRVPDSWIPPAHVLDARVLVRLYKDLVDERTGWLQRVHATLFHHGVAAVGGSLVTAAGAEQLAFASLPAAGRYAVDAGMRQVDRLSAEMLPLRKRIVAIGSRQAGCKALQGLYGIGPLLGVAIWEELGDCRRFTSSDDAVRHAGLDVTVWSSDGKRTRGHLAKQGPPVLRWALYEAAVYAARPTSPDYAYYCRLRQRLDAHIALITVARKLARRCFHTLRNAGDSAFAAAA
jgi:transposase